jgi:hypothetical protein
MQVAHGDFRTWIFPARKMLNTLASIKPETVTASRARSPESGARGGLIFTPLFCCMDESRERL